MRAVSAAPTLWLLAQSGSDPSGGDLLVFLAFAAAWLGIALWALSIGGKRWRLAREMKEGGPVPGDREA
jgi:CcmD family protein